LRNEIEIDHIVRSRLEMHLSRACLPIAHIESWVTNEYHDFKR
jgi:hypothetical protein